MSADVLNVLRIRAPVTNLGYGHRIVLWVAGCSIGCAGCCSKDTWTAKGRAMDVAQVARLIEKLASKHAPIDGLTISGGEPTESSRALCSLIEALRGQAPDWDVLMYSGLPWRRLKNRFAKLVEFCDVVVPEPFIQNRPSAHPLLGSGNQSIRHITPKAEKRYGGLVTATALPLEAFIRPDGVSFSGVPKSGDLDRFTAALARRGITIDSTSWS